MLDSQTVTTDTIEVPLTLKVAETETERKIRTGEMTPFGSTDVLQKSTKR